MWLLLKWQYGGIAHVSQLTPDAAAPACLLGCRLFESLDELLRPPPAPQQEQQQRQQQQQQQQRQLQAGPPAATQTGAAAEAVQAQAQAQAEPEGLQLEVEGGSDADTAEVALTGHRRTSDEGEGRGIGRRLQSAVVVDEYRRRDHRLGRVGLMMRLF